MKYAQQTDFTMKLLRLIARVVFQVEIGSRAVFEAQPRSKSAW